MKSLFLFMFFSTCFAPSFELANKKYIEGDFSSAIELYEQLVKESEKGEYLFNLGSAFYRNDQKAEALFYFRKAAERLPRDEDVRYSLNYVRSLSADKFEDSLAWWQKLQFPLSASESALLLTLISCVIAFLTVFRDKLSSRLWGNIRNVFLGLFVLLFLNQVSLDLSRRPYIVVKSTSTKVYSGPGSSNVVLFEVGKGSEALILNKLDKWVQVQFSKSKKGWVYLDSVVI